MSSHHNNRFFILHHYQVEKSKERKAEAKAKRLDIFLARREVIQFEVQTWELCIWVFALLFFLVMAILGAVYGWWGIMT